MAYILIAIALLLAGADQLIKLWVLENILGKGSVRFIHFGDLEVINLKYTENTGAAFSILEGNTIFLSILSAIIVVCGLYMILARKITSRPMMIGAALVVAGGLGNLIDRIFRGFVVDYIQIRLFRFAVFNFADCCVVIGIALVVIWMLFGKSYEDEPVKEDAFTDNPKDGNITANIESSVKDNSITADEGESSDVKGEDGANG